MLRIRLLSILMAIASIYTADSIELLANYKLWKSVSPRLIYDFSGNSRHLRLSTNFIATDRGFAPNYKYSLSLATYGFLSLEEYTITVWMLNFGGLSYMVLLADHDTAAQFKIQYKFDPAETYTLLHSYKIDVSSNKFNYTPKIEGWNLHTIRIYKTSSNPGTLNANFYLNLNYIHSTSISSGLASFNIKRISLYYESASGSIITNEIWVHRGFSNISDLNCLILNSASCGCDYKCPTISNQACLLALGLTYNKSGQLCDTSCTDSFLSCSSVPTHCILKGKANCQYRLYDLESLECIFYCPNSSCICPTITSSPVSTLLSCNCKPGYNKISEAPQACISIRCLEFHRVGYKYVCDTTESGYSLDDTGECCICAYGYVNVLDSPYTCILKIDNCIEYTYIDTVWKCLICNEGYFLFEMSINNLICAQIINSCIDYKLEDDSPICIACEAGFYLSESKIECLILNCLCYIINEDKYNCIQCSIGHSIDSDGKCNQCSHDYEKVSEDPFICIPKLEHCSSYRSSEGRYICQKCSNGYKLSSSGLCDECADGFIKIESENVECKTGILNCLDYDISQDVLRCMTCKEGYSLDYNYECTICDYKYMHHPQDISICIKTVPNCLEYEPSQDTIICKACDSGYLSVLGTCYPKINLCSKYTTVNEQVYCSECHEDAMLYCDSSCNTSDKCVCKYGSYMSSDIGCEICPKHCKNCNMESNTLVCLDCENGYDLIDFNCIKSVTSQISEPTELALGIANKVAQGAVVASVSASILSLNMNSILSIIGILQILNYILLYNINIPSRTRVILEGISFLNIWPNIFDYFIPNNETLNIERYNRVDINNELFLINAGNYERIRDDTICSKFSVLYENLRTEGIEHIQLNNFLLIRRIAYGINMILFYSSPFIQVVINSSFSFAICHYILVFKPFKTRLDNIMNFYLEFLTFLILSIIGAFIKEDLSSDLYAFVDWSLVVLIYSIIIVPAIANLVISIKDLILYLRAKYHNDKITT